MSLIGEITCVKNGCFVWIIQNFRIIWRIYNRLWSPKFTYSGREYFLALLKGSNTNITARFIPYLHNPPNTLYAKFQLYADWNIESVLHCNTLRFGDIKTEVSVDCTGLFSEESGTPLFDDFAIVLRVKELTGSGVLPGELQSDTSSEKETSDEEETNSESDTSSENETSDEEETHSKSDMSSGNETSDEEETHSKTINKMLKDFKSLLASGENSDVTLVVGGKQFSAHRIILCARSTVFKSMLCHDTSERDSGTVNIDGCDPDKFQDFLTYVYTGSTRHIDTSNVISLYTTSDKYLMGELKEACVTFMKAKMSVEGFCDVATLALRHDEMELVKSLKNFFFKNNEEITETDSWMTFLVENPKEANEHFIKPLTRRR